MRNFNMADVQQRLADLGFNPGPIDGNYGPLTRAAVAEFQRARKLPILYPGTIGPKTLDALALPPKKVSLGAKYPWIDIVIRKKGLHEHRNYSELSAFLKSDGRTLGDPRKLPWCGDLAETAIVLALPDEPRLTNPYLARNWLKFGVPIKPTFGSVAVFWRGSKNGISGHVGFLVGQEGAYYYVLGGNQKHAITIAKIAKNRLLGSRWPVTYPMPTHTDLPVAKGGKISYNEA